MHYPISEPRPLEAVMSWLLNDITTTYNRAKAAFRRDVTHQSIGGIIAGFGLCMSLSHFMWNASPVIVYFGFLLDGFGWIMIRPNTPYWSKLTDSSISKT
jgi:hypothetical protein